MKHSPCYGCERRHPGCHNVETCEDWAKQEAEKERRMAAEQKHRELNNYKADSIRRFKKLKARLER